MPEVEIMIGGRPFEVACQDGEQPFLEAAAGMLDAEARTLAEQVGRMPEARMLLMAGLMLADKTVALDEQVSELRSELAAQQEIIDELKSRPLPQSEEPRIPAELDDAFAELTARAEALAAEMEEASK